jgi:hypothetical protein
METQVRTVQERVLEHGWSLHEREASPYWWATEIWTLESEWTPRGFRLFLLLLVDPMSAGARDVWAVAASRERPIDQQNPWAALLPIGHGWREQVPAFVAQLDALRTTPIVST